MTNTERIQANNEELREAIEMAENLPAAGGGGASVQSDWNQTDETAADFIKNKPFGDEVTEIIPETEVTGTLEEGMYLYYLDMSLFSGTEQSLSVVFDGTKYDCTRKDFGGMANIYGNGKWMGLEDSGEPFCIFVMQGAVAVIYMDDANSHTISLSSVTPQPIKPEYIPNIPTGKVFGGLVMYVSLNKEYVYIDRDLTTKATLTDIPVGVPLVLQQVIGGNVFMQVLSVCMASMVSNSGDGYALETSYLGEKKYFYTAEYTP